MQPGLIPRIAVLAVLFAAELACASLAFDGATLEQRPGTLTRLLAAWGAPGIRLIVGFLAILGTFSFLDRRPQLAAFSEIVRADPIRWLPALLHVFAVIGFGLLGANLYLSDRPVMAPDLMTVATLAAGIAAIGTAATAVLSAVRWRQLAAIPGMIWGWAAGATFLVSISTTAVRSLWLPASRITFELVHAMLRPFVALTLIDPEGLHIGTRRFSVIISPQCSGLEGVSLLLLFGSVWLILFRRECRFPQALLLLPLGATILFLLNSVRIAVLLLIGHAGARQIAAGGFHSQAGWICFNAVSLGLCVGARRLPWFTTYRVSKRDGDAAESAATPLYLGPFVAILAAGMLSRSMSGSFEWLYPLRLAAPLAVLWHYRQEYSQWSRRISWRGFAAGVLVFGIWIGMDRLLGTGKFAGMPVPLGNASEPARLLWIAARALAAVVTVPLAEELTFRGFLIRRLRSRDFDSLPAVSFSWPGLLISAVGFGLLHGDRWPAGIVAGLVYGLVFLRRGDLGDAVVAHATTNALLAAEVIIFGQWQYW